jgi:hypothetical protein
VAVSVAVALAAEGSAAVWLAQAGMAGWAAGAAAAGPGTGGEAGPGTAGPGTVGAGPGTVGVGIVGIVGIVGTAAGAGAPGRPMPDWVSQLLPGGVGVGTILIMPTATIILTMTILTDITREPHCRQRLS